MKTQLDLHIRKNREDDYPFICEMFTVRYGNAPTPEQLAARDQQVPEGGLRERWVAEADGVQVGMATLHRFPSKPEGQYEFSVIVHPEHRGNGFGRTLLDHVETRLKGMGAREIIADFAEDDAVAREIAGQRGYEEIMHVFDSTLDLSTFYPAAYEPVLEQLRSEGFTFVNCAEMSDQIKRDLHAIIVLTDKDIPGEEDDEPRSYEEFEQSFFPAYWFWPEGHWIAYHGDEPVGVSGVGEMTKGEVYSLGTGVKREYRGRGLALALKVLTLAAAKAAGYPRARTQNASTNQAMLHVNRKLGYVREPGQIYVRWRLDSPLHSGGEGPRGQVRIVDDLTDDDYAGIAALMNRNEVDPLSADSISEADRSRSIRPHRRIVLRDGFKVIATANVFSFSFQPESMFRLGVHVHPDHQRQGIGSRLLGEVERFAIESGARQVSVAVRSDLEGSKKFAEQHHFKEERTEYESFLDLDTFNVTDHRAVLDRLASEGIAIEPYHESGDTESARRRLYEISCLTEPDVPGAVPGHEWSFEEFQADILDRVGMVKPAFLIAVYGERWVGMSTVSQQSSGALMNDFTGVIPEFRGRGIALALKVRTLEHAKEIGARTMRTYNDSLNAPMLAVNRKLGYQPQVGWTICTKEVG
ncbi:MAG: GNAT family N-acetyltransferase [Fimbriimonadaceae bacterium]|nr:GNAT family N-acetyltransferase [Fimbriimonadaceae bacterium]